MSDQRSRTQVDAEPLVSIVIPTMNSASFLRGCLEGVRIQTWKNIETIVVDGYSKDSTLKVAREFGVITAVYGPRQDRPFQKLFAAPYQWNYGVNLSKGKYIYLLASDIRISPRVVEECVRLCELGGCDAIIVPEMSYGEGYWAQCKRLQRSFFVGDSSIESPMFFRRSVWDRVDGLDERTEGYMDWDLKSRIVENRGRIGRSSSWAFHYEGRLELSKLLRKKYVYGRATRYYFSRQRRRVLSPETLSRFSLLRPSYIRNMPRILENPKLGLGFAVMTTSEYLSALFGAIRGVIDGGSPN